MAHHDAVRPTALEPPAVGAAVFDGAGPVSARQCRTGETPQDDHRLDHADGQRGLTLAGGAVMGARGGWRVCVCQTRTAVSGLWGDTRVALTVRCTVACVSWPCSRGQ